MYTEKSARGFMGGGFSLTGGSILNYLLLPSWRYDWAVCLPLVVTGCIIMIVGFLMHKKLQKDK